MNLKLQKTLAFGLLLTSLSSLTACSKVVDCDIEREHVHLYVDEESTLKRYIQSEKETVGNFTRTDNYKYLLYDYLGASRYGLYPVKENLKYLYSLGENLEPKREELVTEEIVGPYYGYGYGVNPVNGTFEYYYGQHTGLHIESNWREIPLDTHTDNPVRDITYKVRLYKVNVDDSVEYHDFGIYDVIDGSYNFFKPKDFIQPVISEPYQLSKNIEHK